MEVKNKKKWEDDLLGILGLTLMGLLAIFYWKTDVSIFGHFFFLGSILAVGIVTSYKQQKGKCE